jgi:hypothetical protein
MSNPVHTIKCALCIVACGVLQQYVAYTPPLPNCCTARRHGKRVAVKVMQLHANALLGQQQHGPGGRSGLLPSMVISEAVLISSLSHPNLVQVRGWLQQHSHMLYSASPSTVLCSSLMQGALKHCFSIMLQ